MRYLMQQKFVSVGDDYNIKDQNGNQQFFVDGYGFSFGKRFSFQDPNRNELLDVKQRLFTFSPTFIIYKDKIPKAKVRRAMGAVRDVFHLTFLDSKKKIKIVGKLVEHEYKFYDKKKMIAEVSKKWFRNTDTYAIDISGGQQDRFILATAVIVDLICHEKESKHKR